jgi:hypothetical protein
MLSSIHPLGERARNNRWGITVTAHLLGSWAGGVAIFTAASLVPMPRPVVIAIALAAAALDIAVLARKLRRIPGPRRQVNEDWIQRYRGWVYGFGFGFQLGAAVLTIVTTGATYLALALTAATDDGLRAGVVVGTVYGITRSLPLLLAANVRRPEQLAALHRRLRRLAEPTQVAVTAGITAVSLVLLGVR